MKKRKLSKKDKEIIRAFPSIAAPILTQFIYGDEGMTYLKNYMVRIGRKARITKKRIVKNRNTLPNL